MKWLFVLILLSLLGCNLPVNSIPETLVNKLTLSTVQLQDVGLDGKFKTICTGIWISEHHILTARHCIKDGDHPEYTSQQLLGRNVYYIEYRDSDIVNFPALENKSPRVSTLISVGDKNDDLALLYVLSDINHSFVSVAQENPKANTSGWTIGHPIRLAFSIAPAWIGEVRNFKFPGEEYSYQVIQINGSITHGSSGGGLFDNSGQLLGICSFGMDSAEGFGFFVSTATIKKFLANAE